MSVTEFASKISPGLSPARAETPGVRANETSTPKLVSFPGESLLVHSKMKRDIQADRIQFRKQHGGEATNMGQLQTIKRIWTNQYPDPPHAREHSLIEKLFCTVFTAITLISLSNIKPLFGRFQHAFMDSYVILWVAFDSIILFVWYLPTHWAVFIAVYRLIDIVSYRMFFILVKSQERPWSPDILRRSVLIVLLNFYECVACVALVYLRMGCVQNYSGSVLDTPFTALYYILVTKTTLGY